MTVEPPRILCVDDEPNVLEGLQLHLRRKFSVTTALSGEQGLEKMRQGPPFVAVVSDMRMPGMSGAEFLKQVRASAPDTVRLLLTGQSDLASAVSAVNEGQIFRFLTKPCPPPALLGALEAAVQQHRLLTAERELLQKTLRGTVKVLADVLALASPQAFGKVARAKSLVEQMLREIAPDDVWVADVACLFAHLGAVHLPPATLEKWYRGEPLAAADQSTVDKLPQAAEGFLAQIPRLEAVRDVISSVARRDPPGHSPLAARAVLLAFDFDALRSRGDGVSLALETLKARAGQYDPKLVQELARHVETGAQGPRVREVTVAELKAGMVLTEDLRMKTGVLLVPRGFEITAQLQSRFAAMADDAVREPVRVVIR